MNDEQKNGDEPENVGVGGNLIGATKEERIEQRAIKQRWPIPEKYRKPIMNRIIKKLIDTKLKISDRDFNQAFNALLRAEAQNQADEHKQQPDEVNINLKDGVQIVLDRDWYGNESRLDAISAAASDSDSDGLGPVQGSGSRPPVGKNGDGVAGGD